MPPLILAALCALSLVETVDDAGKQLGWRASGVIPARADGSRIATLRIDPPEDAARLKPLDTAVRTALERTGVVLPLDADERASRVMFVLTLRVTWGEEKDVVTLQIVDVETGQTLGSPEVTLKAGVLARPADINLQASDMDGAMLKLSAMLVEKLDGLPGELRYQRVAVLPFEERGAAAKEAKAGSVASLQLQKMLGEKHRLLMVDRKNLDAVLEQQRRGMAMGDEQGPQIGKMVDAQALVFGDVSEAGDRFLITARIVSVETGQVLAARGVSVPRKGMIALSSNLLELKDRQGAAFRSIAFPGWGQFFIGQKIRGVIFSVLTLGFLGATLLSLAIGLGLHGSYLFADPTWTGVKPSDLADLSQPIRSGAALFYLGFAAALVVTLSLWTLNVIDAAVIAGAD